MIVYFRRNNEIKIFSHHWQKNKYTDVFYNETWDFYVKGVLMKSHVQVAASPILFAIDALGDFLMRFIAALLWDIVSWDITW